MRSPGRSAASESTPLAFHSHHKGEAFFTQSKERAAQAQGRRNREELKKTLRKEETIHSKGWAGKHSSGCNKQRSTICGRGLPCQAQGDANYRRGLRGPWNRAPRTVPHDGHRRPAPTSPRQCYRPTQHMLPEFKEKK